jgi:hypothetical protein
MPTPESEAFKASKPAVPPTFDGVDYDDNKALKAAQDSIIREQWVQSMMARLIREELGKCYHREGVNHLQNCAHLRGRQSDGAHAHSRNAARKRTRRMLIGCIDRYLEQLKHAKIRGYLFEQQNYYENREG